MTLNELTEKILGILPDAMIGQDFDGNWRFTLVSRSVKRFKTWSITRWSSSRKRSNNVNTGATGKYTVILQMQESKTGLQKVWIYDFFTPEEAINFFNFYHKKAVSIFYTWPDGSVIFDKNTETKPEEKE